MLQNASLLVKIGADTAENEQHFVEILPIICQELAEPDDDGGTYGRAGHVVAESGLHMRLTAKFCKFGRTCKNNC